jgi:hypothetical protein
VSIGYSEAALVANRTSVLMWGGSDEERRLWADEAAAGQGGLRLAATAAELEQALRSTAGVVFVPNGATLPEEAQRALVRCLREQEERPKVVVALPGARQSALDRGALRTDLDYALSLARVDLDAPGVREGIKSRRAAAHRGSRPSRSAKSAPRTQARPARRAQARKPKVKRRR